MSLIKLKLKEEITYTLPYYFIGQSIITEDINFNPNKIFIGQKWERDMQGYAIVGLKDGDSDFGTINKVLGEKTHTLTIDEMPKHNHPQSLNDNGHYSDLAGYDWRVTTTSRVYDGEDLARSRGGNQPHNNIQPSKVKIIWTRKA